MEPGARTSSTKVKAGPDRVNEGWPAPGTPGARRNSSEPEIFGRLGQELYGIPIYACSKTFVFFVSFCSLFRSLPGTGQQREVHIINDWLLGESFAPTRWLTAATWRS